MLSSDDVCVFSAAADEIHIVVVRGERNRTLSVIGNPPAPVLDEALADAAADASLLSDISLRGQLTGRLSGWTGEVADL